MFPALSSWTAALAFWRAFESMAFCDGCLLDLSLLLDESALPFAFCDRFREWPLAWTPSPLLRSAGMVEVSAASGRPLDEPALSACAESPSPSSVSSQR